MSDKTAEFDAEATCDFCGGPVHGIDLTCPGPEPKSPAPEAGHDQNVIVAFQIWEDKYDGDERDLLGVFTTLDALRELVDKFDPEKAEGSSVCYYTAELDAPGEEAQWEMYKDFPEVSEEELAERAVKEMAERQARIDEERAQIDRNRRDFFRSE